MSETTVAAFRASVAALGDRPALRTLRAGGAAREEVLSWHEWELDSDRFAAALVQEGIAAGEVVAVFAGNRALWPVAEIGTHAAGGVTVGAYPTATAGQLCHILADSAAVVAVVDTRQRLALVQEVRAALPRLRLVIAAEGGGSEVRSLEAWLRGGESARRSSPLLAELARREAALQPSHPAVIVHTSGSTGEPKGALLSHAYLVASAASIRRTLGLGGGDTSLSLLPFAHAAERVFGLHTRIGAGMEAGLVEDPRLLWEATDAYRPTLFGGMPRFFEKAAERLVACRPASGAARQRWDEGLQLGRQLSLLRRSGYPVPRILEARWRERAAPLAERARRIFGGRLRVATSGGAPLPVEAAELLDAAGVTVLGAYGLTEHLCAAMCRPDLYSFEAAGPPMPGTELRIAPDGEIQLRRCPLTFSGYLRRPGASAQAFTEDGEWLRTGDLGEVDARGLLRVTGRIKELIALSTGRKVAPLPIEARLAAAPGVAQAVLFGEGRKHLAALLFLRQAPEAHDGNGAAGGEIPVCRDAAVLAEIGAVVEAANRLVSPAERVVRFAVIERELSSDAGEITATLKVRRPVVQERFQEVLERLFGGGTT
jgi:long-chain acyl-CoA synthetase